MKKLEEIKQQQNYAIHIFYGEDIGFDDLSIPMMEREVKIIYVPAGHLGELKKLWKGKLKDFLEFDINQEPTIVNNPPSLCEIKNDGFYMWGTDRELKSYAEEGG